MQDAYSPTESGEPLQPPTPSTPSIVAVVSGIAAIVLNLFLITAPLGLIFGIIALICGFIARPSTRGGRTGVTMAAVSLLILVIYAASFLVPYLADPTMHIKQG